MASIRDFLRNPHFETPKEQPVDIDFRDYLRQKFDYFLVLLADVDGFEDISYLHDTVIERQRHLTASINRAVEAYYDGKPAEAYSCFKKGVTSGVKDFREVLRVRLFNQDSNFYRIRYYEENFSLPPGEMFHIPFEHRGKVKSQRYSIPGFPSLYIGTSIYVCWEELGRPHPNHFQAARLVNQNTIQVIDLSKPKSSVSNPDALYKFLMTWPLILASSIRVKHPEDTFKPEYIVPQLMLQWVREMSSIDGIAYETTKIDANKAQFRGEFLNLVIPVKTSRNRGICQRLSRMFRMTQATSIPMKDIASSEVTFMRGSERPENLIVDRIELVRGQGTRYEDSSFYGLEQELAYMHAYEL